MKKTIYELISRIFAVESAWYLAKKQFGQDFTATKTLRQIKGILQVALLRDFPNDIYLLDVLECDFHEEPVYQVKIKSDIFIDGNIKNEVGFLPKEIAHQMLDQTELEKIIKTKYH